MKYELREDDLMSFLKLVQEMNNLEDYTIEKQISGALQKGQTEAYRSGTGTKKKQVRELIFSANREFLENTVEQLFEQVELNEEERDAICEPGNAAIRGRSGTGKTTCLIMNILLHMLREVDFANIETRVTSTENQIEESKERHEGQNSHQSRMLAIKQEMQRVNKKRILLTTTSSSLANQISQSYNRLIDKADKKSVLNIPEGIGIDELLKLLELGGGADEREVKYHRLS